MPSLILERETIDDVWRAVFLAAADIARTTGQSFESILIEYQGREEHILLDALTCLGRNERLVSTVPSDN